MYELDWFEAFFLKRGGGGVKSHKLEVKLCTRLICVHVSWSNTQVRVCDWAGVFVLSGV